MKFRRDILVDLKSWKDQSEHKPLLLMGARQIGKTTVLKDFGAEEYQSYAYFNFEQQQNIHQFFEGNKDPDYILSNLNLLSEQEIIAGQSLLILDEIQECRDALIALKYFQEQMPELDIVGAGSLLGLSIGNTRSFPVGKVEFLEMYPLSFSEYLGQADRKLMNAYDHFLKEEIGQIPDAFFIPLKQKFKEYLLFGSMPEVSANYLKNKDIEQVQRLQDQILRAYELDFVKHAEKTTSTKIQRIWQSIPSQLARENKKFLYKAIRSGARAREYEEGIQWLIQAGLVYQVTNVEKVGIPLKFYEDLTAFKLYNFDTSLLIRMARLEPSTFIRGDVFFTEFKGSLTENYVCLSLKKSIGKVPQYWTSEGKAEVDFVINHKGHIIPIEVKSGTETKAKSLKVYKDRFAPSLRVRVSELNLRLTDDLLNVPLFYAGDVDVFINKVVKND